MVMYDNLHIQKMCERTYDLIYSGRTINQLTQQMQPSDSQEPPVPGT